MERKYDFRVRTNGRSGYCSCGKKGSFIVVEFTNKKGELQSENMNCCAECFGEGEFVRSRFFQIIGFAPDEIGAVTIS